MEEKHIHQLIQNLIERFEYLGKDNFDLNSELKELKHPVTREEIDPAGIDAIEKGFLERKKYKKSHDGAILIPVSVVSDPKAHEEWYDEWISKNNNDSGSYYWKRLEDFLSHELAKKYGAESAGEVVREIDEATTQTLRKMANPVRNEFSYKGLVVGYVQSGKTANFTALIAKAADAGYKLIIVLGGIHNVLRYQTQVRLDRELTGKRDVEESQENYIDLPGSAKIWNRFTTAHNEFSVTNLGLFEQYCFLATPSIAIVKKNVKVLDRLINYFSKASQAARENMPLLIIDDEADQASVDGNANDPDSDPTSTNERIRKILSLFTRKTYVGYTATPFANTLIDMTTEHETLQDDLYPRNFIVSLPQPKGYFGTKMIFQGELREKFVEKIPIEADKLLEKGIITEELSTAVDQFVLCCAVRNLRGDKLKPMSMLVHISHKIDDMDIVYTIIEQYVSAIRGRYNSSGHSEILRRQLEIVWNKFTDDAKRINLTLKLKNRIPTFDLVWNELKDVFNTLKIMKLNSSSEDKLNYTTNEEVKVIAIGGNQLSRGLTLEGLMISYYLRDSKQYDTLLQMGRWFGYRKNYEDLTRVHTTSQLWDNFEHLALVEEELRSEIYRYEEEGMTPVEMAIAIKAHRKLNITAKNKMGAGRLKQISLSDSLNQTIWLPLDQPDKLKGNYDLGENFIKTIANSCGFTNVNGSGVYLANKKIDGQVVFEDFLKHYYFVDKDSLGGPGLDSSSLLTYIERRLKDIHPELTNWSVALVGNTKPTENNKPINYGGIILNRIQRSRKHTARGYNIGVLTDPKNLKIDLADDEVRSEQNPLLLLYLIWKDSKAGKQNIKPQFGERIDLFRNLNSEKHDCLGLAIVLPESKYEPYNYIGQ